jgi:hypothetical protein
MAHYIVLHMYPLVYPGLDLSRALFIAFYIHPIYILHIIL